MDIIPKLLTDIPGKSGTFWGDHTHCVGFYQPPNYLIRLIGRRWAYNLTGILTGLCLFINRHKYVGVVTDGGASTITFAWLQRLFRYGRVPHVAIDCLWYRSDSKFRHKLKSLCLQVAAPVVHRFIVWASHEIQDYSNAFGVDFKKFEYLPFHTTLNDYSFQIKDDGYLFAGGNFDRDYILLVNAVRDIDIPTWIATTRHDLLDTAKLPPHIWVEGTTPAGFRQAMAGARLVVVPMLSGLLHSGGQQTCLNAMYMGKPTIAVGRKWATDLIEDGVTGLIVDYGDEAGLRNAIKWLLDNPRLAEQIGQRASMHAREFTTERTMRSVYEIVLSATKAIHRWPKMAYDIASVASDITHVNDIAN